MKNNFKILPFSLIIFFIAFNLNSTEKKTIEQGQTWSLIKKSNKLSPHNSKVLYFFLNDAYSTYQARRFNDWTEFSITDGRNLVRLNKGDRIKIVKSKHQNRIFEVELLDGFEKNRKYFVIKEDLISDYMLVEVSNES
ncbi:hypothetical protein OA526_03780 [Gammaproteobacteria bacterium]|nr:hypothetical protein [Gammaproteobacteria bacterium]